MITEKVEVQGNTFACKGRVYKHSFQYDKYFMIKVYLSHLATVLTNFILYLFVFSMTIRYSNRENSKLFGHIMSN